jgi:hypothetical protein
LDKIDYNHLREQLQLSLNAYYETVLSSITHEPIYAVGLYTGGELSYLVPTANTELALLEKGNAARWSPPDWKYHLIGEQTFSEAEMAHHSAICHTKNG